MFAPRRFASAPRPCAGFTLMELLATLAILAVLSTLVVPLAKVQAQRHKEQELRIALRQVRDAIDDYKRAGDKHWIARSADASGYPKSLDVLWKGEKDLRKPDETKIYFIRRIPRDPFCNDPTLGDAQTWRLRSYASPPDQPKEGDDVYDIRSTSDVVGLNGVPYSAW